MMENKTTTEVNRCPTCGYQIDRVNLLTNENVRLRAALRRALRQWAMYAEMYERNDGFELKTEKSPEADDYRAMLAMIE